MLYLTDINQGDIFRRNHGSLIASEPGQLWLMVLITLRRGTDVYRTRC